MRVARFYTELVMSGYCAKKKKLSDISSQSRNSSSRKCRLKSKLVALSIEPVTYQYCSSGPVPHLKEVHLAEIEVVVSASLNNSPGQKSRNTGERLLDIPNRQAEPRYLDSPSRIHAWNVDTG